MEETTTSPTPQKTPTEGRCLLGLFHSWTTWGPPYEGLSLLGRRKTYQQRECKRCGRRQKAPVGPACHTRAQVPANHHLDQLLSAPGDSRPELAEGPSRGQEGPSMRAARGGGRRLLDDDC